VVTEPAPLSPDDARILALESASITGHTLKLIVLEPGEPLDLDALRTAVDVRTEALPRARERVDTSGPEPRWVPAPDFDVAHHVRRRAGRECATDADLRAVLGPLMAEHLDRARPLWTLDLIGPLADGREVVAVRMHHAMVDGIAGMRFVETILLDPGDAPLHDAGTRDADAATVAETWERIAGALRRELGHPATASPFDRPITAARELAFARVPLSGMRRIGRSRPAPATVNDVLLAIVAGGLHAWLGRRGDAAHLRAPVPVSLHHRDEGAAGPGNRDSFLNVALPLAAPDPLARLDRIREQTRAAKEHDDPDLLYDLFHALGRWGWVGRSAVRAAESAREFSVAVSNVPGPRDAVAVAGRGVRDLYSSSEPGPGHALRISAISCGDEMGVGFCTDPTALPGVAELAEDVAAAYRELAARAGLPA
jgi:diacylglycerol O-acyltransferase / wax synthase